MRRKQEVNHYWRSTKSWYAANRLPQEWVEEVYFYTIDPDAEMAMRWYALAGELAPRLEVFVQSAAGLASLPELLAKLGEIGAANADKALSPERFCHLLDEYG